jgi:hypothetical protein
MSTSKMVPMMQSAGGKYVGKIIVDTVFGEDKE